MLLSPVRATRDGKYFDELHVARFDLTSGTVGRHDPSGCGKSGAGWVLSRQYVYKGAHAFNPIGSKFVMMRMRLIWSKTSATMPQQPLRKSDRRPLDISRTHSGANPVLAARGRVQMMRFLLRSSLMLLANGRSV